VIITKPGIYDMDAVEYHADPCPSGSLSSTGARALVTDCPAMFRYKQFNSPRSRAFDIGTAGHLMVLEPHLFDERVVVVRGKTADGKASPGYQTADAKKQRDTAYEMGKVPLLEAEAEKVRAMREALWSDPVAKLAFKDGQAEQSMFWQDDESGIWCRTRPDFVPASGNYLVDYKTAASANPDDFARAMLNCGYHQQAAWYLDGYQAVTGKMPDAFWFIVQMKEPPFLVSVCKIDQASIEVGRTLNRYARGVFAWCQERNEWPGYQPRVDEPGRVCMVSLPPYAFKQYDDGMDAGTFEPPVTVKEHA